VKLPIRVGGGRVSEAIATRIKKDISEGSIAPGEKLPSERELAQRFDVSRVSVREAYRSLEELGLIVIRRGAEGGAFIANVGHESVSRSLSLMLRLGKTSHEELTEARLLIEPPIARLAARRASRQDLDELQELIHKQELALKGAEDPRRYELQFHRLLAQCAKNLPLKIVMNSVADLTVEAISGLDLSIDVRHHVVVFHRQIFEAIRGRDEEAAYQHMLRHVLDVQSRLGQTFLEHIHTPNDDQRTASLKS
jgi:DNA-binding FadR family transcriptional regulator